MRPVPRLAAVCLAALAAAPPALAQPSQYIAPGAAGVRPPGAGEAARAALEAARWHLGPLRLDPVFELREVAWIDPGGDAEADLTASLRAGLRGYVPVGTRATLLLHALPEYVFWRDRSDASRLGGQAGLGLAVDANRLQLDLKAGGSDLDGFVASELERRAEIEERGVRGTAEYFVSPRFGLWVSGGKSELDAASAPSIDTAGAVDPLANLDRTDETLEGSVRWRPTAHLALGVGAGRSRTRFEEGARDRGNEGDALVADLSWRRSKLALAVTVRELELDGERGSEFGRFSDTTGSGRIAWTPRERFGVALYGLRNLTYSAAAASPWFVDERFGGQLDLGLGRSARLSAFLESGERRFEDGGVEEVTSSGGSLGVTLGRLDLRVGARRTEIDAARGERTYSDVTFGVAYGKLRGAWY
jgi:hypothetical protein